MVWFQCEDCGENLKKPKLQNHFRMCSANKLSCIDCGVTFNRESVQGHTQCVSEAEKYGPKLEGKGANGLLAKGKPHTRLNFDVDLSTGLSTRPPWVCSLCNVKATSRETLLLHSEGKKHKSKARAFQASNNSNQTVEPSSNGNSSVDKQGFLSQSKEQPNNVDYKCEEYDKKVKVLNALNGEDEVNYKKVTEQEVQLPVCSDKQQESDSRQGPIIEEEKHSKKRKRKADKSSSFKSAEVQSTGLSAANEVKSSKVKKHGKVDALDNRNHNNTVDQVGKIDDNFDRERSGLETEDAPTLDDERQNKAKSGKKNKLSETKFVQSSFGDKGKRTDKLQRRDQSNGATNVGSHAREASKLPVKWKKLIKSVLKSTLDGVVRIKKLQKAVLPMAMEVLASAGVAADESHVRDELMYKVYSSSSFILDRKFVRLA